LLADELKTPQSRLTSPLHLKTNPLNEPESIVPNINDNGNKVSKVDFSYLSHRISSSSKEWSPNKEKLSNMHPDLNDYVDSKSINSKASSISNYNNNEGLKINQVHGILEEDKYLNENKNKNHIEIDSDYISDDDNESFNKYSNKSINQLQSYSPIKDDISRNTRTDTSDNTANTSSFLNSSVPTQELWHDEIDLPRSEINKNFDIDDDSTPIVQQQEHFESTPTYNPKRETINNEDLKLSAEAITEIFANDDTNTKSKFNRIQSTTSSIYSALPQKKSIAIDAGLKSFRISSFKPALHKHLSQPLSELENETDNLVENNTHVDSRVIVNKYQPVAEDEPLDFNSSEVTENDPDRKIQYIDRQEDEDDITVRGENDIQLRSESKARVSVLNQSLFQNQYDTRKNPVRQQKKILTVQSQQNVQQILNNSDFRYSDLSYSSSIKEIDSSTGGEVEEEEEEEDASALFVTSIYAFNSETLESENDSSICLSFDQDEIAFTYNLDDSGWGEVTLLSSLKRGWVPMNYFRSTVTTGYREGELKEMNSKELTDTRAPLRLLLKHAGTFLLNPQSKPVYIDGELRGYTFDVECFNGITDGLRKLLIDTDCISRSNSVVQNKPVVRKMRKKLLRGWADLIAKGKDYLGTIASTKIEYLQLLTFHLLQKAITFLDIWGLEQDRIRQEEEGEQQQQQQNKSNTKLAWDSLETVNLDIIYLDRPPILSYRVNEVYNQLITYLCLIAGRIDLVEHNAQSFAIVGVVIGHINLLINEYFFIIKLLRSTMNEKESEKRLSKSLSKYGKLSANTSLRSQLKALDHQIEKLRQLVEELNSYIRILHNSSRKTLFDRKPHGTSNSNAHDIQSPNNLYFYSHEGGAVVVCSCKMIELCSNAYYILKNTINFNDDMMLPLSRKYPNYLKMSISPEKFIKQCTISLVNDKNIQKQVSKYKRESIMPSTNNDSKSKQNRASKRYSIFKTGNSTDVLLSSSGLDFLSKIETDNSATSPFLSQNEFDEALQPDNLVDLDFNVEDELIRSTKDNKIIGASFRALIYLLTDENNPPNYFFISCFFLTFRIFSDSAQLLEALITRFDVDEAYKTKLGDYNESITESKIRSRRKLIAKFFKIWLESYWNSKNDYVLLAPLMNFFNEGMKIFLPIESYQLLVVASKLIGHPPIESTTDRLNYYNNFSNNNQLLPRKISSKLHKKTLNKMSLGANTHGLLGEIEAYNSFLDDIETYDLEKVETSTTLNNNDSRVSLSLSLNIELKNSNSNSILLTSQQVSMIKTVVMSYRRMLGTHWYKKHIDNQFELLDTKTLIDSWWNASQESWKILNDDLTLLNFNGLEIAKQLTLIENKLFCSIQVGELLNQNFTTKKLHLNLSPNIQKSILFTNLLSDYVIESILKPNLQMRQRIHAFKCWLKIGICCLYLRNFNSLASIMTSLQSFLITRITEIWEGLSDKYQELFHYLASIIHPNKNYSAYRERLKDFLLSNLQENLDIPTVPYLSLFLQDLTFIVDGNPNYRSNTKSFLETKLINIDKYFKITQVVSDIQTLQISYKDVGELGVLYNDKNTDIIRSETIKNLNKQLNEGKDLSFADMFDINGVPVLQELILLEIWKVKQTNARDDDRSWKLSCSIQPRVDN
jgi:hypothetical protein